ncbi:hypothetical protein GUJ93_ZPchr0013g36523 [Zizania palustris]|uniref:Uncharacterized protein n=1 Tax=Zizania palustris TaxID=103762 RepID=A0A8J5WYQ9_ZIZPA|nr:hypothetical protein GUJ93_ZPchr0013g36523 [Zizania palustris]
MTARSPSSGVTLRAERRRKVVFGAALLLPTEAAEPDDGCCFIVYCDRCGEKLGTPAHGGPRADARNTGVRNTGKEARGATRAASSS